MTSASPATKELPTVPASSSSSGKFALSSKLPTFQGLKSILRPSRGAVNKDGTPRDVSAGNTPKRENTVAGTESGSTTKKVDFTPSTKSRYAVKLAAASPSPSKIDQANRTPPPGPMMPFDPAAYLVHRDSDMEDSDEDWEDADSEVDYPVLPTGDDEDLLALRPTQLAPRQLKQTGRHASAASTKNLIGKAQDQHRRESKEFKSIFTTLEHPSRNQSASSVENTKSQVPAHAESATNATTSRQANVVTRSPGSVGGNDPGKSQAPAAPSTIRPVRASMTGGSTNPIQTFEDPIQTIPHGLPGKKRRREPDDEDDEQQGGGKPAASDMMTNGNRKKKAVRKSSAALTATKANKTPVAMKDRRKTLIPHMPGSWAEDVSKENYAPAFAADLDGPHRGGGIDNEVKKHKGAEAIEAYDIEAEGKRRGDKRAKMDTAAVGAAKQVPQNGHGPADGKSGGSGKNIRQANTNTNANTRANKHSNPANATTRRRQEVVKNVNLRKERIPKTSGPASNRDGAGAGAAVGGGATNLNANTGSNGKSILSLARLNVLSRPKERK